MNLPQGFHTLTPYMFVDNADRYIEFLVDAFGAEEVLRANRDDGKIANAQVRLGDSTFMLSESSSDFPAMCSAYYLYVEDADESVKKAVGNGAELIMEVSDMPYGDRQGGVLDTVGNIWWISQRLSNEPYT